MCLVRRHPLHQRQTSHTLPPHNPSSLPALLRSPTKGYSASSESVSQIVSRTPVAVIAAYIRKVFFFSVWEVATVTHHNWWLQECCEYKPMRGALFLYKVIPLRSLAESRCSSRTMLNQQLSKQPSQSQAPSQVAVQPPSTLLRSYSLHGKQWWLVTVRHALFW